MTSTGRHKAKDCFLHGRRVRVDAALAPMIQRMWDKEIYTKSSCEKGYNGKNPWICFSTVQDYCKFLNIIAEYGSEMYEKLIASHSLMKTWKVSYSVDNLGVQGKWKRIRKEKSDMDTGYDMWEETHCTHNDFNVRVNLYFNKKYIPYIESKLGVK